MWESSLAEYRVRKMETNLRAGSTAETEVEVEVEAALEVEVAVAEEINFGKYSVYWECNPLRVL